MVLLTLLATILLSGCQPAEPVTQEPEEEMIDQSLEEFDELDQIDAELDIDFETLENLNLE